MQGTLTQHLIDTNTEAIDLMDTLVKQMAERESATKQLKAQDQMLWVQRMNNIRDRAMEIADHDLIYT